MARRWNEEHRNRQRERYKKNAPNKAVTHGLVWKIDRLIHPCGMKPKYFGVKTARPADASKWVKGQTPSTRIYLKQSDLLDKVTCGKCLEVMTPQGRENKRKRTAKAGERGRVAFMRNARSRRVQSLVDEFVANSMDPQRMTQVVAILESKGYQITPPAPPEPEFRFPSEDFPVLGQLFKEVLSWITRK